MILREEIWDIAKVLKYDHEKAKLVPSPITGLSLSRPSLF